MKNVILLIAIALVSSSAMAQSFVTVVGEGTSEYCFSTRERACDIASLDAENDASDDCRARGGRITSRNFIGYFQARACSSSEFKCVVTQATWICRIP